MGFLPVLFKVVINDYFLWHEYFIFLCIVSSVLLLYGTAKSIFTIMPKLKNHHKKSILYFRDISSMSVGDFKKKIGNLNEEEYEDCVLEQIHILSCVATKKHEQFRAAILIFFSGIILFLICLFIFF